MSFNSSCYNLEECEIIPEESALLPHSIPRSLTSERPATITEHDPTTTTTLSSATSNTAPSKQPNVKKPFGTNFEEGIGLSTPEESTVESITAAYSEEELKKVIVWLADRRTMGKGKKEIAGRMANFSDKVDEFYERYERHQFFEFLCWQIFDQEVENPLEFVNNVLIECRLGGLQIETRHIKNCFDKLRKDKSIKHFHEDMFGKVSFILTNSSAIKDSRFIAHFLLSYEDCVRIYAKKEKLMEQLQQVLNQWKATSQMCSWETLKPILELLKHRKVIQDVEKILCSKDACKPLINQSHQHVLAGNSQLELTSNVEDACKFINIEYTNPKIITYTAYENTYRTLLQQKIPPPENIKIECSGRMIPKKMDFAVYSSCCQKFLKEFLGAEASALRGCHIIPPKHWWKKDLADICTMFELASRTENLVFVTGFDLLKHFDAVGIDVKEVAKKLKINLTKLAKSDTSDRMLVIQPDMACIYNLMFSKSSLEGEVLDTLKNVDAYSRLLLYSCGNVIFGEPVYFINCVAAPYHTSDSSTENFLILDKETLGNSKRLRTWLDKIHENFSHEMTTEEIQGMRTKLKLFFELLLASIATKAVALSVLSKKNVINYLWLRPEQQRAVEDPSHWKIVQGPYGSGKSLVARSLLEKILEFAEGPVHAYMIVFDKTSGARDDVTKYCKVLEQQYPSDIERKIIAGNIDDVTKDLAKEFQEMGISNVTPSSVLEALVRRYVQSSIEFHLLCDEVDKEVLDEFESRKIGSLLEKNQERLEKSHIAFFTRSMEKRREVFYDKRLQDRHNIDIDLRKNTGMEIIQLKTCMRNTKKVFELTQNVLEAFHGNNILPLPDRKREEKKKVVQSSNSSDRQPAIQPTPVSDSQPTIQSSDHEITSVEKVCSSTDQSDMQSSASEMNKKDETGEGFEMVYNDPDDLDFYGRFVPTEESRNYVKTTYTFQQSEALDHGVVGKIPCIFFLNNTYEKNQLLGTILTKENAYKLKEALKKLFSFQKKSRLIICSKKEEVLLFINVLRLLKAKYFLSFTGLVRRVQLKGGFEEEEEENADVTITNYAGSRGREAEQVILCLDPHEHHQRQTIVEGITRSTDELILVVPYYYGDNIINHTQRPIVGDIIKELLVESIDREGFLNVTCCPDPDPKKLADINLTNDDISDVMNVNVFKSFGKPIPVRNVKLTRLSDDVDRITWDSDENRFLIRLKHLVPKWIDWKEVEDCYREKSFDIKPINSNFCKLQICSISEFHNIESEPVEVTNHIPFNPDYVTYNGKHYGFLDFRKLMFRGEWETLINIINAHPSLTTSRYPVDETLMMVGIPYKAPLSFIEVCINNGADVEDVDRFGRNAIHFACSNNRIDILHTFRMHAAIKAFNKRDKYNQTPLYKACRNGSFECVEFLLKDMNVDVDIRSTRTDKTAYDAICDGYRETDREERKKQIQALFNRL